MHHGIDKDTMRGNSSLVKALKIVIDYGFHMHQMIKMISMIICLFIEPGGKGENQLIPVNWFGLIQSFRGFFAALKARTTRKSRKNLESRYLWKLKAERLREEICPAKFVLVFLIFRCSVHLSWILNLMGLEIQRSSQHLSRHRQISSSPEQSDQYRKQDL